MQTGLKMKFISTIFLIISIIFTSAISQTTTTADLKVGDKAPAFSLPDLENNYVFLRDFSGEKLRKPWKNKTKYAVVISFFATWCGPCKKEIPYLEKLQTEFKEKNIRFFLIDVGEEREVLDEYLKDNKTSITILHDRYKQTSEKFGANSLPRLIVMDKNGIIQLIKKGFKDGESFMIEMKALLATLV